MTSERYAPRAERSAMTGYSACGLALRRMLGWTVVGWFLVLVSSGVGWSQNSLRAASGSDPQCVEQDCRLGSDPSSDENPTPGNAENEAIPAKVPSEGSRNNPSQNNASERRGERDPNAELVRHPERDLPVKTDSIPEPPTEFQEFVASSVGHRLPIYGHKLFDHVPTTFTPIDQIPVTDDYQIGPGEEILIRAWGQIDLNGKLVVDRSGEVFLPKVGALSVAGLRYQQLPDYFRTAIERVFRNFDLTVSLGQLRSI